MTNKVKTGSATSAANWGERVTPEAQGVGGFDECWYPIALSAEVEPGKIHGTEFLDGRVIVVRNLTGAVSVLSAYCRHYGADLVDGDLEDGCVRCPFHHWKYDMGGQCIGNDVGDRIPSDAALFFFPTAEKWGLIWAYNGKVPRYEVPSWSEPEEGRHFSVIHMADYRGDPFLAMLNVIDTQHLRSLHGLDVEDVELVADGDTFLVDMTIGGDWVGLPKTTRQARMIATNAVVYDKATSGVDTLAAGTPIANGFTRLYIVTGGRRADVPADEIADRVAERERASHDVVLQDIPILDRIRFRIDRTTRSDKGVIQYLRYVSNYPRSHPSKQFIT